MQAMTKYEKEIFIDIHGLPLNLQEKIANLVHLVRKEFVYSDASDIAVTDDFLSVCGKWKDARTVEEQLGEIYSSRSSSERTERMF